jgi:hypothetical protein
LPPIINNNFKEKEIQSDKQLNKKIDFGVSQENPVESETNKKVDVGISAEIPLQKIKENRMELKRPLRVTNSSLDNVTLYSMLSKQTREL